MVSSSVETPVFINTNLGTRISLPIFPDITAKEFKSTLFDLKTTRHWKSSSFPENESYLSFPNGKLEKAHLSCFPEVGKIRVNGLLVKRKSYHYHLSESLPLKYAFQGSRGAWFLQIEAHKRGISNKIDSIKRNGTKGFINISPGDGVTGPVEFNGFMCSDKNKLKFKRKKRKILEGSYTRQFLEKEEEGERVKRKLIFGCSEQSYKQCHLLSERLGQAAVNWSNKWDSHAAEAPSETLSESIAVSGIIKKYFSNNDEVTSRSGLSFAAVRSKHKEKPKARIDCKFANVQLDVASPFTCKTPLQMPHSPWKDNTSSEASSYKCKKPEVGKRLLLASNNLGLSPSNQMPALSVCKSNDRKSAVHKSTIVRSLVFEIPDERD